MVRRIFVAPFVLAIALVLVPLRTWAQLPTDIGVKRQTAPSPNSMATEQERAILLEFFNATGGTRWKQSDGWNTASDPCLWHGVLCMPVREDGRERWAPVGLHLIDNGLAGAVPASLFQLGHLKQLWIPQNQISAVPPELFTRADASRLDVWLAGNPLPEVLTRVTLRIENVTGVCISGHQMQLAAEFDGATGRVRYRGLFCPAPSEEDSYCLATEQRLDPGLDLVSRGLRHLRWTRQTQSHRSLVGPTDHEERFRAVLTWGDGTSHEITIFGGQAPIEIQIGQQLLRSLVWPDWTSIALRVKCDIPRF